MQVDLLQLSGQERMVFGTRRAEVKLGESGGI